ncbi:hypothetical protein J421_1781 [Gemmatirosa kalamazoonensis]|uniref:DUF5602 domain-containing protein n=1 Tax=Gemmatirosa kalamazoonensis TaxID=861299 RepID=W0RIT5_9BACT|nr:DUF5602 domain-containing protein [Gemmatirosa kalamazoonensis]AHG89318.1 hypothetical protein J421_1781 [Gemmatirosa kalamazoonensis]
MRATSRLPCLTAAAALLALAAACSSDSATAPDPYRAADSTLDRAGYARPGVHVQLGAPQPLGHGTVRTYVALDAQNGNAPFEIGVALSADALDGLPSDGAMQMVLLPLPEHAPAPYQFAEVDWNPQGHPPPGVYTVPHFDFHFYTVPQAARDAILPSDPQFAAKANDLPTGDVVPPFYVVPGVPAEQAVPMMGVHWFDTRSPELQGMLGHPEAYHPFTKTFIYGSWNGAFTFLEPMVTREYLLTHPDDVASISVPQRYAQPGDYPTAYRVTYDPQVREYLVGLTSLVARQ